jgi:hypothetical protein
VHTVDAGALLEHLGRKMVLAAVAAGGIIKRRAVLRAKARNFLRWQMDAQATSHRRGYRLRYHAGKKSPGGYHTAREKA